MKNRLLDLNNHLFAQLERLSDEELIGMDQESNKVKTERLQAELLRTQAMIGISGQVIQNAKLALDAEVYIREHMIKTPPPMIGAIGYEEE